MGRRRPFARAAWLGQAGQVVIPSLFIFPSLMLFVFLIFETAKLSREKIRHQFAVDAAAFVEMTNYSDFLNRTAYVDGPFPMRIFYEGFHDTQLQCLGKDDQNTGGACNGSKSLYDVLYEDGVFPRDIDSPEADVSQAGWQPSGTPWRIEYGDPASPTGRANGMNQDDPDVATPGNDCAVSGNASNGGAANVTNGVSGGSVPSNCVVIVSMRTAKAWNINWDDANQIYKLYVQIYQLLGSVESAQYSVLSRLSSDHNFLKKSYWLNIGDQALPDTPGLVSSFNKNASGFLGAVHFHCADHLMFMGNQIVYNVMGQPYQIWASVGDNGPPTMPQTIPECSSLFQVTTVDRMMLKSMQDGWPVSAHWTAPANYFNVDVNAMMSGVDNGPTVRATVHVGGYGAMASIWPDPTPKFQVRTTP